jgi:hypothetical protein
MASSLKTYRIVYFDPTRPLVDADFIHAANDEQAISLAEAAEYGTQCEIWDSDRLVAQLAASSARQASAAG